MHIPSMFSSDKDKDKPPTDAPPEAPVTISSSELEDALMSVRPTMLGPPSCEVPQLPHHRMCEGPHRPVPDIAGLVSRITTSRPSSSGRGSTPSPQATTPEFKPRRLIKSASSNMLRRSSPSSSQLPTSSTFLPDRPNTRDSSPAPRRFVDSGRRAASSTVLGSFANQSPAPLEPPPPATSGGPDRGRLLKRMSFMVKSRPASKTDKSGMSHTQARVLGEDRDYDVTLLLCVERVEELWCDTPDCVYVYLFGEGSQASFKIPAYIIDASPTLKALAYGSAATSNQLQTLSEDTTTEEGAESPLNANSNALAALEGHECRVSYATSGYGDTPNPLLPAVPKDGHLYFPTVQPDQLMNLEGAGEADRIIAARNMFAFLLDKPLVATKRQPTEFEVLYSIANHLEQLGFFDERIGDYGLGASTAFKKCMDQFGLQDVRGSNEKILKAVILGERMRSTELYYDAFTHAAGNFKKVRKANPTLYEMITINTRRRLERENHELEMRQDEIGRAVEDFDFPHIFNGSAQSKVTAESRVVRFQAWKQHFHYFRSFVLGYYKHLYGAWPPKANKKNTLRMDGLSRVVLQQLYNDMCVLYDLIVDRDSRTTRKIDVEVDEEDEEMTEEELEVLALRKIMSEHDRSSLPMSPPMPFDLPRLPSMTFIDAAFDTRPTEEKLLEQARKLKYFETTLIMAKAHNMDQGIYQPFLQAYASFEQKESAGKSLKELRDMRFGHWLFLYSVLQRLPLLVVDAPNLRYKDGVEYFLCKSPIGPPPWLESSHGLKPHTDEIADNTAEGIFYRSHCWIVGSQMMQDYILRHPPPPLSVSTSFQGSPYLGAVDEDTVPDFSLAQYQAGMQQASQGEPEYMHSAAGHHPHRSDSSATHSTVIATARYSNVPDLAIRNRSSSQQRRTFSQPAELYFADDAPYAQPGAAYATSSAPVSPGGAGIMRPPSRPGSSYFGPGGIASRPASRQSNRPVSRSGYVDEELGRRYEAYSVGPRVSGTNGMVYGNPSTPPGGSTESGSGSNPGGSIVDATGSVMGTESVAGGNGSRSTSQTRAMRMGPSTFDDILEGMEKGSGKVYEIKAKVKGDKDKKLRNRLSMFGSGGMGGSTSSLGSKV